MNRRNQALTVGTVALATMVAAACSGTIEGPAARKLGDGAAGSGGASNPASGGTSTIDLGGGAGEDSNPTGSGGTAGTHVIDPGIGQAGGAGAPSSGDGTPEVCDGVDNDSNGIIDDVDAGKDGVCDCLNIGTIGQIGPWSNGGNLFKGWLDERSPNGVVPLDDKVLTPELLAPLQVIVVLHVATIEATNPYSELSRPAAAHHAFTKDEANAFGAWVKLGGGAMATIGYTDDEATEIVNVNRLLDEVEIPYSTTKLSLDAYITDWTKHPVTNGVKNILAHVGVEPDGPNATTLAHDPEGRVALQVGEPGDGRVVVWGDEWITYDSEWADIEDQQVELYWLNILKWLSPPKTCQVPIPPALVR